MRVVYGLAGEQPTDNAIHMAIEAYKAMKENTKD
jgi:hypothetical protein